MNSMKLIYIVLRSLCGWFKDDFTQSDKDQGVNHSFEGVNNDCDWIAKKLDPNEQLHVRQSSAEGSSTKDILSEKVASSGFSELGEQGKGFTLRLFIFVFFLFFLCFAL